MQQTLRTAQAAEAAQTETEIRSVAAVVQAVVAWLVAVVVVVVVAVGRTKGEEAEAQGPAVPSVLDRCAAQHMSDEKRSEGEAVKGNRPNRVR